MEQDPIPQRPTLVDIVRASGYSKATVSRALNGGTQVSAATRAAIRAIANRLGWEPTPEFAALNRRRWASAKPRGSGILGFWSTSVNERMRDRFRRACGERGYRATILDVAELADQELDAYLELHGIRGLVINSIVDGSMPVLDLQRLTCVVLGDDLPELRVDRVCHDWQDAADRCVEAALAAGHRRIGFTCLPYGGAGTRLAMERAYACADARLRTAGCTSVPVLITGGENPAALSAWIDEHQLDAVIADIESVAWVLRQHAPDLGVAVLRTSPSRDWTGIAIRGERIMERVVALIHEGLASGRRGASAHPERLLIPGDWISGTSLKPG